MTVPGYILPAWLIAWCIVCRFNCGRWFARNDDDGSVERFLMAENVPMTLAKTGTTSALGT